MTEMVISSLNTMKKNIFSLIKSMMCILDGGGLFHVVIGKLGFFFFLLLDFNGWYPSLPISSAEVFGKGNGIKYCVAKHFMDQEWRDFCHF